MSRVVQDKLPCPLCPSSDAYHIYDDGHGYCFSCNSYVPSKDKQNSSEYTYEYLPWRGITADTFRFYGIQTKIDSEGKPVSIGMKYANGDVHVRLVDKKEFYWVKTGAVSKPGLFGKDKFAAGSHKYVTITEGALDAASLFQVIKSPVVAVTSSSSAVGDCILDHSYLSSFERIYLSFDSDEAGREAVRGVAKLFDYDKIFVVKFSNRKDANEYLQHGEGDELRNIWWNSKRYLPETIVSSQEEFDKILAVEPQYGIPYPFPTLTAMTYGIRTGETVLLTAQEGVGKTELMHAIEYQLLRETNANVGAIFLEEPQRRHLEALAGIHLERPVHVPNSGCTRPEVSAAVRELVKVDDRLHLYTNFGSDDPDVLLDTIRFLVSARQCRYILLDHISMVVSGLATEDERRKLDYFSTKSQMMVKELDFSLIMVSHINDFGQTRGSRYIGKIADIRIDVSRDMLNDNPEIRNTSFLVVSKNRYCGQTGPAGRLLFNPLTFTYKEDDDARYPDHQRFVSSGNQVPI